MKHLSRSVFSLSTLALIVLLFVPIISAQNFVPTVNETLLLDVPDANNFGAGIALDGDTLFVSASQADGTYLADEIYVFNRIGNQWTYQMKLFVDDEEIIWSMDIDGDTALVGTYTTAGVYSAHVFVRNGTTWSKQAKLQPDGSSYYGFGHALALEDDTVVTLAYEGDGVNDVSRILMFAFTRSGSTWTQTTKLILTDYLQDSAGYVALDGNTALIGTNLGPGVPGNVFVMVQNGNSWTQQAVLALNSNQDGESFGSSVALDGTTALIGAPYNQTAYIFTYDGTNWNQQQEIFTPIPSIPAGGFSTAVAIEGNGAIIAGSSGIYTYTFDGTSWKMNSRLYPKQPSYDFGSARLELAGTTVAIGRSFYQEGVYIFDNVFAPITSQEILVNGGFDDSQTNGVPNGWTRKNTTKDERRCNKPNQPPVAHSGNCAYFMKGNSSSGGKLAQNVNLQNSLLQAGDVVRLNGFYNKQSTGSVYVYLYVNYANFPEDQRRIILTQPTNGYQPVNQSTITLKETPTRIRVVLENQTTSGKTWFDGLNLIATTDSQNNLLSLPIGLETVDEVPQTESLIPLP